MTDKETLVSRYLLNDISENIVGMPYSRTEKPEHEVINEAVSTKVIPLLSESERMKLVGKGPEAKTRLWVYETMKSWKPPHKAPSTADMRLILAKYYGYTDWRSCFNHYLPIAQEVQSDVKQDKQSIRIPFFSINFRPLMYVSVTIFVGMIAFTLFKMEQLFSRMADDRPAIPRQIEKTAPGPILISNDSISGTDLSHLEFSRPEKDLRYDADKDVDNKFSEAEELDRSASVPTRITIFIDEHLVEGTFYVQGQPIIPVVTGANMLQFDIPPTNQPVNWLVVMKEDSCKQSFMVTPQLKINWKCE